MVVESLVNPFKAERQPWEMFFVGCFYSSIAILLSLWVFKPHASLVAVFLTVIACIPIIYGTIKLEEKKDMEIEEEKILIKEHGKALSFFVFLFLGITISFSLWYIFLPADLTLTLFSVQAKTISDINTQVTGQGINQMSLFSKIFFNNIKVLIFCVIFAFIYGFGAIFILTWNASVIGTAIGNFVRTNLPAPAGILSYFAIINHDFASKKFQHVLIDSADLLILAVAVLFVAALMEAFITPVLF